MGELKCLTVLPGSCDKNAGLVTTVRLMDVCDETREILRESIPILLNCGCDSFPLLDTYFNVSI